MIYIDPDLDKGIHSKEISMITRWFLYKETCDHDKTGSLTPEGCFYQAYLDCDSSCPQFREFCKDHGYFHIDNIPDAPYKRVSNIKR